MNLLYVDLFCGAGGTSTGVNSARINGKRCAKVIACVNHDANAIASHASNHPDALHFTEDIRTLNLEPLIERTNEEKAKNPDAKLVLWASLECTNFSKAKGGQPRDADSRTLAEHLFRYIEALDPDYIQIENVEEFMSWGEIDENGHPISSDKGKSYLRWVNNVKAYGYDFQHRILNSANYGAYTSRKRFFGIFAKIGLPIVFPKPTHSKSDASMKPLMPVKDVLDLDDYGKSIFREKPLAERTLERIYAGLIKFVAGGKDAFLIKYNSMGANGRYKAPGIDDPCPVVATQNRLGIAHVSFLSKQFSGHPDSTNVSIEEPAGAITCRDHHAIVDVEHFIDMQYGNGTPSSIELPTGTITANPKQNLVSVERPWIMDTNFGNVGASVDEPSRVITANRKWHYLMNPQFACAGRSIEDPCFTLIARMDKRPPYLITTETGEIGIEVYDTDSPMTVKIKEFMALYGIIDIKMRMLKVDELKKIMGFPEDYVLIGTKCEQKKFIGNAVEVNMSRVLCESLSAAL